MKTYLSRFRSLSRLMPLTGIMLFWLTTLGWSQPVSLPKNHPIAVAAPHLPAIMRYDGTGSKFYASDLVYKNKENHSILREWMKNYPAEVVAYKTAIASYLKSTNPSVLSGSEKELYSDLKAQSIMISQI